MILRKITAFTVVAPIGGARRQVLQIPPNQAVTVLILPVALPVVLPS